MSKNIIIALALAALPVLAQDAPQQPCSQPCAPKCFCGPKGDMHQKMLEKFDTNKDGQLDEQEKEAMKAAREARHAEMKQKMLEKFDTNKDGQLDDQEKEAMKAEFEARRGEKPGCGKPEGPRPECGKPEGGKPGCGKKGPRPNKDEMHKKMLEKFDANKDGQLDDQEKEAMKADFEARHGKGCGHKGPRGHRGHGPQGCPCNKG